MFIDLEDLESDFLDHLRSDLRFLENIQKRWIAIYGEDFKKTPDEKYESLKHLIENKMRDLGLE